MQPGTLSVSDAQHFTSRILVDGVEREHVSWSVDRELSGDLPAQVVSGSGIVQASGTIVWAQADAVADAPTHPFNTSSGQIPRKGSRVTIWSGDGASEWRQFTGLIDSTTGDIGGDLQSSIIDDRDKLDAPFSHEPLLRVMTPILRGADDYRAVGLTHLYYMDAALRTAGFYAVPPREARQALSVPAQSSLWPEDGIMTGSLIGGVDGGPWASTYDGPDGVVLGDFQTAYSPRLSLPMSEPVRFSMTVAPEHSGNTTMKTYYGPTDYVELAVAGSKTAYARVNGSTVCSLVLGSAVRVSLLVRGGTWTLRTDTGVTATGTASNPTSAKMDRVTVTADSDSRVAGFHVCHTSNSTENLYTTFSPSARYQMDSTTHVGLMDAGPVIEPTTCLKVLESISQATLTAMWLDSYGVFNWAPSVVLRGRESVATVTTANDVLTLGWEDSLLGVRSRTEVTHRIPAVSKNRWDNVLWYQGGIETLESGQQKTEFISPPSNTDWIGPSSEYYVLGDPGSSSPSNKGWGSFTGATLTDGDTESLGDAYLSSSLTRINVNTWKLTHNAKKLPSGKQLELRYPTYSVAMWERWLKQDFPLIRGFATVQWANVKLVGASRGPSFAPVLTHELGPWANRDNDTTEIPQRVADYVAEQVAAPQPTITAMEVVADPRRELGDRITLRSTAYLGVVMTALVVGIGNAHAGSLTQSLSVRVDKVTSTYTTYEAYNDALPDAPITYAQWDALGPKPHTYEQFNEAK